jgi:hypothetical protein
LEACAVVSVHETECTSEEPQRLFQNCLEHRCEIAGRRISDLQHLCSRGLLLQRLVAFSQLPPRLGKLALKIGYELFADRPMYC